ncbi:MAG: aspartate carbamoyltransferase catalytic subunit [Deltaproteobacteria bacterium]|nr:aspartate carbamoyltransferase catalytic subunit [Deltaproteobacteria bacterium]
MISFGKHLLSMSDLSRSQMEAIFEATKACRALNESSEKKSASLKGKTVINLFFENSTRTRTSFEIAGKRLSADVINISKGGSSVSKGETLLDTAKNLQAMNPDVIVLRHPSAGAAYHLTQILEAHVINAGDGAHEHPTQGLLDLMTVKDRKGQLEGLQVGIVGDIAHSRVARSNLIGFQKFGAEVTLIGPKSLVPESFKDLGAKLSYDFRKSIPQLDVIMMLRIQTERLKTSPFPSLREYARFFGLNRSLMEKAKPDVLILHPGPVNRGVELDPEVADGPYSVILDQVKNGVAVRMALLEALVRS